MGRPKQQFCPKGHDTFVVGKGKDRSCKQCKKERPLSMPTAKFCSAGHDTFICGREVTGFCKMCKKIYNAKRYIPHPKQPTQFCKNGHDTFIYGRNKWGQCTQCIVEYREKWYAANPLYNKEYINENKEAVLIKKRKWVEEHREELNEQKRQWAKEHSESRNASTLRCSINRSLRIVAWTDWDNIFEFDKNKPKGMTLDHIIPLQGDEVSGLHISCNLQYLTPRQNSSKGKKCNLIEASEWYGNILKEAGLK